MPVTNTIRGADPRMTIKSAMYNCDSPASTTQDEVIWRSNNTGQSIRILAARIVYDLETAGTVAGCSFALGTAIGGAQISAAALVNGSVVGAMTAFTLSGTKIIQNNAAIYCRFTSIAATAAGQAHVELDYEIIDENNTVFDT